MSVIVSFKKLSNVQIFTELTITARQYGEVVLPDAASGNCPGTPRQRGYVTVPVQGGYGTVFAIMVQCFSEPGAVAVQFVAEPRTHHRIRI